MTGLDLACAEELSSSFEPCLNISEEPYGMFEDFQDYPWVLPPYRYTDLDSLLASLQGKVIDPAERKAQELTRP